MYCNCQHLCLQTVYKIACFIDTVILIYAGLSKQQNSEVQVVRILKSGETQLPATTENSADLSACEEDVGDNSNIEETDLKANIDDLVSAPDMTNVISGSVLETNQCLNDAEEIKPEMTYDVIGDIVDLAQRGNSRKPTKLCTICGKMFRNLPVHMHLHRRPDFKCQDCGRKFARSDYLTEHQRVHSNERPFLCVECGRSFGGAGNLRAHLRTHSDERRYHCELCGKWFRRSSGRNEHIRNVHEGVKAYRCSRCPRAFASANGLKLHTMSHTNERPHACTMCTKRFKSLTLLDLHWATHTGERRFPCAICGRRFTQKSAVRMHEVTQHTEDGGRCHECELCGQRFSKRSIRDAHVRRHKGEKPHACSLCHWSFAFVGDLRNHMVKKHKLKRNATSGRPQQLGLLA